MTEKYYVPSIEDLRVGYECEIRSTKIKTEDKDIEEWTKYICSTEWPFSIINFEERVNEGILRTPFLTQEQIKEEKWEIDSTSDIDIMIWGVYFRANKKIDEHQTYKMIYSIDHSLIISRVITNTSGKVIPIPVFSGKCNSINEFRIIKKLLGI